MTQRVLATQLTPRYVTRKRGEEAYLALGEYLRAGPLELDLDRVGMLSTSFLDGLASKLLANDQAEAVTFVSDESRTMEKLGRIAATRSATLHARSQQDERHEVPHQRLATLKPVLVDGAGRKPSAAECNGLA